MLLTDTLASDESQHRLSNFPSHLALQPPEPSDRRIPDDPKTFEVDVGEYGIAARTWDAAIHLAAYLCEIREGACLEFDPPSPFIRQAGARKHDKAGDRDDARGRVVRIVDLGSGTCFLPKTIVEHLPLGAVHMVATDLPEVVSLMQRNIGSAPIEALPLVWGDVPSATKIWESKVDVVLCSDLVFFPFLFVPLLKTLLALTTPRCDEPGRVPMVIIGYQERTEVKEAPFFALLGRYFVLEHVLSRPKSTSHHENGNSSTRWQRHHPALSHHILHAHRHPATLDIAVSDLAAFTDKQMWRGGLADGEVQWELSKVMGLDEWDD